MKIGIQTWGSYGDIRPFQALAEGLQTVGHDVTLVTTRVDSNAHEGYRSQFGVTIIPVASPVIADKKEFQETEDAIFREPNSISQTQMIIERLLLPAEHEMFEASEKLCADDELVIGHFFHYPLNTAAAKHGRPYVSVALVHSAIPSAFGPSSGIPDLGAFGNRLAWRLVRSALNKKLKKYPDQLRARHRVATARDLFSNVWASDQLTLIAVSRILCERKDDWPDCYKVCGFLNPYKGALDGPMPPGLQDFLAPGTPPVYMTLGSTLGEGNSEIVSLFSDAARKASVRAVVQVPNWRSYGGASSKQVHVVDSSPHDAVFPHCSAIVHHGGAGTSQSALRAAKPSVVVPHTSEQAFWGRELERIGVAYKPIARMKLTSDLLSTAIQRVIASKAIHQASMRAGTEMSRENGVASAVRFIHERFPT